MPLSPERIARVITDQAKVVGKDADRIVWTLGMGTGWLRKVERGKHWPCFQTLERIGAEIDLDATDILVMADEIPAASA